MSLTLSVSLGILYLQFSPVEPGAIEIVERILCISHIFKCAHKVKVGVNVTP